MESALQYPILLVHGMGFRDYRYLCYWGRIPQMLESLGCRVFFGNQDSNASVETNGAHLAARIDEILKQTGAEKVHIIAHSKGGLDSRYAISSLGMGDRVASLTTVSTPHHGSRTVDKLLHFVPRVLIKLGCFVTDCWFRLLGDKHPETYRAIASFTTQAAEAFNAQNPNHPDILYQSYAFVMRNCLSDVFLWLPNIVVRLMEDQNDGLVVPDSAKWGEFKGIFSGVGNRGISHCDEVDMRRMRLSLKRGDGISDILEIYEGIVRDLQVLSSCACAGKYKQILIIL